MTRVPPALKPGDLIGMVCPAGFMEVDRWKTCVEVLEQWGYRVREGKTLTSHSYNYFSGTDQERLQDFQEMLDDPEVKAIFCARGGYGISRILDQIRFKEFKKSPKWIIGYSDVTALHCHVHARYEIATLHAPMAAAFLDGESSGPFIQSLRKALQGEKSRYVCPPHPLNRTGRGIGALLGGNLSLLTHLIGTRSQCNTKDKILFLEEVGEYVYRADRMLIQLLRAGLLDQLGGLVVGSFSEMKDTERPFGVEIYERIAELTQPFDYPVCFGFPVGHTRENLALKCGVGHALKVGKKQVLLEE